MMARFLIVLVGAIGIVNLYAVLESPHDPMSVFNIIAFGVCVGVIVAYFMISTRK